VWVDDLPSYFHNALAIPTSKGLDVESSAAPLSAVRTDLPYKEAKRAWLDIFEAQYVRSILNGSEGNISKAARDSGMDRRSVQRILKRLEDKSG
jgi:ActR/RegA family two-component response regulator